jgi:large subunit ribosomal protein L18
MAHKSTYSVPFRRRLEEKTDYAKRLALLKSGKTRLVVRKSNSHCIVQAVEYLRSGDKILAGAHSKELEKFGYSLHKGNLPSAYLTGYLCGIRAKKNGVNESILDIGLATPVHGTRIFAAAKGYKDSGMSVNCGENAFPSENRINGEHLGEDKAKIVENAKNEIKKTGESK